MRGCGLDAISVSWGLAIPIGPLIPAILAAMVASAAVIPTSAKEHRSRELTREFRREQPCPSMGTRRRRCLGYVKDQIVPLACGGPDAVVHMQWQTVSSAEAKDR